MRNVSGMMRLRATLAALSVAFGPVSAGCGRVADPATDVPPRVPIPAAHPHEEPDAVFEDPATEAPIAEELPIEEEPALEELPAEDEAPAAVYVDSAEGADDNPGTEAEPLRSIEAGVRRAAEILAPQVRVAHGVYTDRVTLAEGISILGGFDPAAGWAHDLSRETIIDLAAKDGGPAALAFHGRNVVAPTLISGFVILTAGPGIHCSACPGLSVQDTSIRRVSVGTHPRKFEAGNSARIHGWDSGLPQ